jgi:hypothetical protein
LATIDDETLPLSFHAKEASCRIGAVSSSKLRLFARLMRERAELMPPGPERADKLAKADQADATAKLDRWLSSPELKRRK